MTKLILYKRRGAAAKEAIRLFGNGNYTIHKYYGPGKGRGWYYFEPKETMQVSKPATETEPRFFLKWDDEKDDKDKA